MEEEYIRISNRQQRQRTSQPPPQSQAPRQQRRMPPPSSSRVAYGTYQEYGDEEEDYDGEEEEIREVCRPRRRSLPSRMLFLLLRLSVIACLAITVLRLALPYVMSQPSLNFPGLSGGSGEDLLAGLSAPGQGEKPGGTTHTRRSQVYNILLLGRDAQSGNTDSIIVVRYDVPGQKLGMISIPRDTAVKRTWQNNPKINNAFYGAGPDTLKEEIFRTFGIPIDYYILVDLKGFIALVDQLGGVDVEIPVDMNYDDPTYGQELHIHFQKGPAHLDGQAAMEAVRYRHDNDNPDGTPGPNQDYTDVGRAAFQRQVLTQLARKVISWNSIPRLVEFVDIFRTYVKTDLTASNMLWFAGQALKVDLDTAVTQGSLEGRGDAVCRGVKWCYVFQAEDILPVLNQQVNPYREPLTEEDLDLIRPDRYLF